MLKYIELKSNQAGRGPAWIARVKVSKSGRTVYFNGRALKRAVGGGVSGNHFDMATGEEYWVSGVKRNGLDRHWAGSGIVWIEVSAVTEYLRTTGAVELDTRRLEVIADLPETSSERFTERENARIATGRRTAR
jgi:hypothetical protein